MAHGFAVDVFELIELARSAQAVSGAISDARPEGLLGLDLPEDAFGDSDAARSAWQAHRQVVGSGDDAVKQAAGLIGDTGQALHLAADAYQRGEQAAALSFFGIMPDGTKPGGAVAA